MPKYRGVLAPISVTPHYKDFGLLVGREPGRPGGVPADRHFAQYEGGARSTEVFGSDRLTHHVHILEMNGDSYRLKRSRENSVSQPSDEPDEE